VTRGEVNDPGPGRRSGFSSTRLPGLRALGARPVVADALDPDAVASMVAEAEPEVIVHQLTALSGSLSIRKS
jgi:hypothetical protein